MSLTSDPNIAQPTIANDAPTQSQSLESTVSALSSSELDSVIERVSSAALLVHNRQYHKRSQQLYSDIRLRVALDSTRIQQLCQTARPLLLAEPSLLRLSAGLYVVADTHGQLPDVCSMLQTLGRPPAANYLFLGDYVDRGQLGVELFCLLLAYKCRYPAHVHLLRGNHESPGVNRIYGFYEEVMQHAHLQALCSTYECLPLAALIKPANIFCVHGGLSPYLTSIEHINRIRRPCPVPSAGVMCDLLWSDPVFHTAGWSMSLRRIGFGFGQDVVDDFCARQHVSLIVRGHEVQRRGYSLHFGGRLLSLFSAPNYNCFMGNDAAVLHVPSDNAPLSIIAFRPEPLRRITLKRPSAKHRCQHPTIRHDHEPRQTQEQKPSTDHRQQGVPNQSESESSPSQTSATSTSQSAVDLPLLLGAQKQASEKSAANKSSDESSGRMTDHRKSLVSRQCFSH